MDYEAEGLLLINKKHTPTDKKNITLRARQALKKHQILFHI